MKTVQYRARPGQPTKRPNKQKRIFVIGLIVLISVAAVAWPLSRIYNKQTNKNGVPATSGTTNTPAGFDKTQHSLTDPTSVWVIVNKPHGLSPLNYKPSDLVFPDVLLRVPGNESMQLRKVAADALEQLFAGAKTDGYSLMLSSGYRSYDYQVGLYKGYVKNMGQSEADKSSARPGHSEHQTGLAADVEPSTKKCELDTCFADTPEGQWIAANAYKYGFVIRYTSDKVDVTGYEYEPWHLRYVGNDLAAAMHSSNIETLEEFFAISGGANY